MCLWVVRKRGFEPVHGDLQIAQGFRNSPSWQLSTIDESDRAIRLNY
jgi:hypothetical protein